MIIEPSYEFSTEASKANVFNKGYTRINDDHFRKIGLKPLYRNHINFSYYTTRTEIVILKKIKKKKNKIIKNNFICPINHDELLKKGNKLISKKNNYIYRIKDNIALLDKSDQTLSQNI